MFLIAKQGMDWVKNGGHSGVVKQINLKIDEIFFRLSNKRKQKKEGHFKMCPHFS